VIIDPKGRLPPNAKCLQADGASLFVVCAESGAQIEGIERIIVPYDDGQRFQPRSVIDALYARGLRRILIEGGAMTISSFIAAGAVDRLHLLVAPVILGSGKPGLSLPPIAKLSMALRPRTRVHVLPDGDVLFDCDLRSTVNREVNHGSTGSQPS
jgi:riboflavin biosynthesis pyrimidine reductase